MTFKTNKLRNAITLAIAGSSAFAITGTAFAQDKKDEKKEDLDTIVVTGSRIPRSSEVEGASPVLTLDRQQIEGTGLTSVGDVLFNLSAADGGALRNVTTSTNGSDGTQNISLRGLGAGRTLLLVNGRRWVSQSGGAVDLNTIPISVVQRVEVLRDGASAIYGSDAIAGVINVITRKNFDGAEANVYFGQYTKGDGTQTSYDFTVGSNSDRWNAVLGVAYQSGDPVYSGDRDLSAVPVFGGGDLASGGIFGSGSNAYGNLTRCAGATSATASGFRTCTAVAGGPFTLTAGRPGTTATDFHRFVSYTTNGTGSSDRYNFSPVNYLLQPIDRLSIYGQGSLALTDSVNANVQAVYVKRSSVQQLAQVPLTMDIRGTNGPQWAFAPTANNVFNPFGQDLRGANFRSIAVGPRQPNYVSDNTAITMWLDGSFQLFGRDMYWDAGYSYLDYRRTDSGKNYINLFNLRNAVGRSRRNPTTNALECLDTAGNVIRGCVPFNVFGGPDLGLGAGVISRAEYDAMVNYIRYTKVEYQQNTAKDYFANLSGTLFDMPAGAFGYALGMEVRHNAYINRPDALVASGGSSDNFSEPTQGNLNVKEYYLELNAPVLADIPGFKLLELNAAARRSDYTAYGRFGTSIARPDLGGATAKKWSIKWQVFDDLLVRATRSESFRAPGVTDLFAGGGESFPGAADPCNTLGWAARTASERARCQANGVPVGGVVQPNSQIRSLFGGNPNLKPETGTTTSIGFVYSPSWATGLNFNLDWFRINLKSVISGAGAQTVLNNCYRDSGLSAANRAQYCGFIERDATGNILNLRTSSFNTAHGKVEGYDFGVNYQTPETAAGKFAFQWDSTYNLSVDPNEVLFGVIGEYDGSPNWRLRSNFTTTWQKGDWDATWAMRYYSAMDESCSGANYFEYGISPRELCNHDIYDSNGHFLRAENHIGARLYHDVQVGWKAPWNARISVGARNLFGTEPPRVRNSFAQSFDGAYDLPGGGFFYLNYNQKF